MQQLVLGPWIYEVRIVEDLKDEEGHPLFGCIESDSRVLSLRKGMAPQRFLQTLFHELLHDVDDRFQLDLGETGVCVVEDAFASLLIHNPELTQLLISAIRHAPDQKPDAGADSQQGEGPSPPDSTPSGGSAGVPPTGTWSR